MSTVETSILETPVQSLDLPARLKTMFEKRGLITLRQALTIKYAELAEEKNLGATSIKAWMTFLEEHNLCSGRQA